MDAFDYVENEAPPRRRSAGGMVFNILTIVFLLSALCVAVAALMIFINPNSGFNPFPPATKPVLIELPTETPTIRSVLPSTWTPAPTEEPTITNTPRPSATLWPSSTPYILPTQKGKATVTPGGMSFIVKSGTIKAIPNLFHPDAGCNWMGVGGQAYDLSGAAIQQGLIVQLGGTLEGKVVETQTTLTTLAPQYGPGGYEFTILDHTVASSGTMWVQLLDQAALPLSDKIYFDTYTDCEKNLIIIYFSQVK